MTPLGTPGQGILREEDTFAFLLGIVQNLVQNCTVGGPPQVWTRVYVQILAEVIQAKNFSEVILDFKRENTPERGSMLKRNRKEQCENGEMFVGSVKII